MVGTEQLYKIYDLEPLELSPKKGLALINGTQFIASHAVMVIDKMYACLKHADITGAMMIEGLQGRVHCKLWKKQGPTHPLKSNHT